MPEVPSAAEGLIVETATGGPAVTNGYLVGDPVSRRAVMIDAPYDASGVLLALLRRRGWSLDWLLLTHGHWDHIGEHATVTAATGAKLAIHTDDGHFLSRGQPPGMWWDQPIPLRQPDAWLDEKSPITVGRIRLTVIATPGHSPGGVCLLLARQDEAREDQLSNAQPSNAQLSNAQPSNTQLTSSHGSAELLFSGDTLFADSVGRLDLPGGDPTAMLSSLRRLMELPDELRVLPGHGPDTTIGQERRENPYVRQALSSASL